METRSYYYTGQFALAASTALCKATNYDPERARLVVDRGHEIRLTHDEAERLKAFYILELARRQKALKITCVEAVGHWGVSKRPAKVKKTKLRLVA